MEYFATPRLIEASAALDPSSRALLNIWLHRDLSDEEIGRMAGIPVEDVAARKQAIVLALAETLDVVPDEITAALGRVTTAPSSNEPPVPRANAVAEAEARTTKGAPTAGASPAARRSTVADQSASPMARPAAAPPDRDRVIRRRRGMLAGAGALVVAAIVVVIVLVSSGGTQHAVASTSSVTPASTPGTSPNAGASQRLNSLSLEAPDASGTASISRQGATLVLNLRLSHLPTPSAGRYEVWLYDSIIDARPLGFLTPGATAAHFPLPHGAARYRDIDISLQAPGAHYDSGESYLRASNPVG